MRWLLLVLCVGLSAEWSLSGEALCWRPTVYRSYTAALGPDTGSIRLPDEVDYVGEIKPSYSWGYRVAASATRCRWSALVKWTSWIHTSHFSVDANDNQRLWLPFAPASVGGAFVEFLSPGDLKRRDSFKYQVVDALLGRNWRCVTLLGGVRYARLRYRVAIDAEGTDAAATAVTIVDRWRSDLQGVGPRVGIIANSACWRRLFFSGEACAACLFGTIKGRFVDFGFSTIDRFVSGLMSPVNLVFLNGDLFFGIGYAHPLGRRLSVQARFGYEISYYTEGNMWTLFTDREGPGVNEVKRDPFALDGWVLRLRGSY